MSFDPGAFPYVRLLFEQNWVKSNVFETLVRQVQRAIRKLVVIGPLTYVV